MKTVQDSSTMFFKKYDTREFYFSSQKGKFGKVNLYMDQSKIYNLNNYIGI